MSRLTITVKMIGGGNFSPENMTGFNTSISELLRTITTLMFGVQ